MNVTIDDNFKEFIERKMKSEGFKSAEEVVLAALNRWAVDELEFAPGELDALIKPALEELERGEGLSPEEVRRQLEEHKRQFLQSRLGA